MRLWYTERGLQELKISGGINRDYAKNETVTKWFRNLLLKLYPGLLKEESYRRFAAVLLFSHHYEKDTNEIIIPADVLADIEDKENEYVNGNYNAEKFLKLGTLK